MTDLEQLRAALREQPGEGYPAPDVARIIARGTRLRRRRQVLQGSAVAAVVAVIAVVAGLATQLREPAPPVAAGAPPVTAPPPMVPASTPPPGPDKQPLGAVVPTGIADAQGERVLYFVPADIPGLPDVHFGLMAGHRAPSGDLTGQLLANVTSGSDLTPGFRVLYGNAGLNPATPVFGYYVGPAAKITTTVRGQTMRARQAAWSQDPKVVAFWFTLDEVPSSDLMTPPRAYAADGSPLTR
ncbi:hypothetical protein [Amycolatopsis sp. GM8]|uniref:hypothetical protein n=1 Tax=Amycolatopsis sp. GM8 TaxID=2896530 RepID=UPI001F387DEA|nr:hypothetical protein [Amycolatopsis sp. GM8]